MTTNPLKWALALLCFIPLGVQAQEAECNGTYAEVTDLRAPRFGGNSSWDILYAEDGMDVFSDLAMVDATTFVAAGSYTKDKDDAVYHPLLVKYDETLKKLWEVREETKTQRTIHRILRIKDGFTVLGDVTDPQKGGGIYIANYDDAGKMRGNPVAFFEKGGDLDAKSFVPAQDGSGFIIAAQFTDAKNAESQYGLLYKVSDSGTLRWKRSFKTGGSTVFQTLQTTLDQNYAIGGQMVLDKNRSAAWLLIVDENGAIKWQKNYPRGAAVTIQSVSQTKDGNFMVAGKARAAGEESGRLSAWIMKTDSTGTPLWQRYIRGDYSYEAPSMIVYEDGRASVLIQAHGFDAENRSHARLVTFSPEGSFHHLEDFVDGQNAAAYRLVPGMGGERILIGYAQTSFGETQQGDKPGEAPPYTFDAWMVAAVPLDSFEDPCAPSETLSPILP